MHEKIAQYCIEHLDLQNAELSEEYYYASLPLKSSQMRTAIGRHFYCVLEFALNFIGSRRRGSHSSFQS